jgi:hypothetical protein
MLLHLMNLLTIIFHRKNHLFMQAFNRVSFYFVAHADDWQLFMAPQISHDIADKTCKVVIIHTTAGDAGRDEMYWKARECASFDSLLFRISVDDKVSRREENIIHGNKTFFVMSANNCLCYFLRLPDGAYDGSGFDKYGNQSLEKLRIGDINMCASVDKKTVYTSWTDLTEAVDNIINHELAFNTTDMPVEVCLNFPESDAVLNPRDHNDHYNTSHLVQSTKAYSRYTKRAFLDYHIIHSNDMLSGEELFWKIGMFCTYHQSVFKLYGHSTISEDSAFIPWCFRNSSYRKL